MPTGPRVATVETQAPRPPTEAEAALIPLVFRDWIPCEEGELHIRPSAGPTEEACLEYGEAPAATQVTREPTGDLLDDIAAEGPDAPCLRSERRPSFPHLPWWWVEGCGETEQVTCLRPCPGGPLECVTLPMAGRIHYHCGRRG